ncbi:MAG: response regulator [Planctomycetes bacterium]|nr:response regulator [Planctomycetota bacterium]
MNNVQLARATGRAIVRRVAWLTLGALLVGTTALAMASWGLNEIESRRDLLEERVSDGFAVTQATLSLVDDFRVVSSRLLDPTSSDDPSTSESHLDWSQRVSEIRPSQSLLDPLAADWAPLRVELENTHELWSRVVGWHGSHQAIAHATARALETTIAAHRALRESVLTAEGLLRLRVAVQLAKLRNDPASSDYLLDDFGRINSERTELSAIKTEVADLDTLLDDLCEQSDADALIDLKDNKLKSSLTRLRRGWLALITDANEGHLQLPESFRLDRIDLLETLLFGPGYRFDEDHQTIVLGRAGLYELSRSRIEHLKAGTELRAEVQSAYDRLVRLQNGFRAGVDRLEERLFAELEEKLTRSWALCLVVAVLGGVVFLRLAVTGIRDTRGQIEMIEDLILGLEQARTHAESATRQKSEFLANMSHELRTPLSAILGFSENLLEDDLRPDERADAAQTIQRNGTHLLRLIDDILDLSKIEAGQLTIESIEFSPGELLMGLRALFEPRAIEKGLDLHFDLDSPIPNRMIGDPTRLRQLLINLIGNSLKFTAEGGIEVRVRSSVMESRDSSLPAVVFSICDTGIGMTPDQLDRVFMPFVQADGSTTRRFGGTGLGLAISKELATAMGGNLSVESEAGAGTRFDVEIPVGVVADSHVTELGSSERTTSPSDNGEWLSGSLEGVRILVAEDGRDNGRLIRMVLTKAGAETRIVENGADAVDEALGADPPYDVILMDMQMPVMDGYAAVATLRTQGYDGPIVALTANAMSTDREKCLAAGCNEYAAKPIVRRELMDVLVRMTSRDLDLTV